MPARSGARARRPYQRFALVLLTEDYKMNPDLCRRLADAGHGDVFPVRAFRDLPARLLDVANRVLR